MPVYLRKGDEIFEFTNLGRSAFFHDLYEANNISGDIESKSKFLAERYLNLPDKECEDILRVSKEELSKVLNHLEMMVFLKSMQDNVQ